MMGGRRRKGGKRTRKMRGGMGYGFDGGVISPGNIVYAGANTSVPMLPTGGVDTKTAGMYSDPAANAMVGGKRRTRKGKGKTKKGGKKSRKSMRKGRKMRGGMTPSSVNSATAGASFTGAIPGFPHGGGTYGNYAGYSVNVPGGNPHPVGENGVTRA